MAQGALLGAGAPAAPVVDAVLTALANDLDAPTALAAIDDWVASTLGDTAHGLADTSDPDAARHARRCSTRPSAWRSSDPAGDA